MDWVGPEKLEAPFDGSLSYVGSVGLSDKECMGRFGALVGCCALLGGVSQGWWRGIVLSVTSWEKRLLCRGVRFEGEGAGVPRL